MVFLDRDGTINVEKGHIRSLDQFELLAGAAKAIGSLNNAEVPVVVVTNQSGIARGFYSEDHVLAVNFKMRELLKVEGAHIDALFFCPHLPTGLVSQYSKKCHCRKPDIGLVEMAYETDPELDRNRAYVVGDADSDMGLAFGCGAKAVLVETGKTKSTEFDGSICKPHFVADSLMSAVNWILADLQLGMN